MIDEPATLIVEKVYTEVPTTEGIKDMVSFDATLAETIRAGLIKRAMQLIADRFATAVKVEHGDLEFAIRQASIEEFIMGGKPQHIASIISRVWVPYSSPVTTEE